MKLELGGLSARKPPFKYSALTRVGFSDTDAQGVVYYGRYMPYFDLARTEYMRHLELLGDAEAQLVMRAASVEYFAPARFDDTLEIFVRTARLGTTSVTFEHSAFRAEDDELMVTATQTLVYIDPSTRTARPIPGTARARIAAFEGTDVRQ